MTDPRQGPWRCFHCDEVFTDRREAAVHFGTDEMQEPICLILSRNDNDLIKVLRMAEDHAAEMLGQVLEESLDVHRAYRNLQSRFGAAVVAAEQRGYEKGLDDHLGTIVAMAYSSPNCRVVVPPSVMHLLPSLRLERYRDDKTGGEVYEARAKDDPQ
jgi:hypothetical protein